MWIKHRLVFTVLMTLMNKFLLLSGRELEKNIVLIGFMGSGKSKVARELGSRLKAEVVATDELVEAKEGQAIQ